MTITLNVFPDHLTLMIAVAHNAEGGDAQFTNFNSSFSLRSHFEPGDVHVADNKRGGCECWRVYLTRESRCEYSDIIESILSFQCRIEANAIDIIDYVEDAANIFHVIIRCKISTSLTLRAYSTSVHSMVPSCF